MATKLPYMMKGAVSTANILPGGIVIPSETLPIITKPISWTKKVIKQQEAMKQKKYLKERLAKRDVIIACRDPKINFYRGHHYSKFEKVPLASAGWNNKKRVGDSFIIHKSTNENPAIFSDGQPFENMDLSPEIVQAIKNIGLVHPTNIQAAAIPVIASGQNTLLSAETGNGKTLAFLIPLLQQVHQLKTSGALKAVPCNSPIVVVIAPGRELAVQITNVCMSLAENLDIRVESLLGADKTKLKMRFPTMSRPDVLVASPGVLFKLVSTGVIRMQHVRFLVLDEVDTLLDDSFSDQMTRFLKRTPIKASNDPTSGVQLVMAGATLPHSMETVLHDVVEMDTLRRVSTPDLHRVMPHVTQRFLRLGPERKLEKLLELAKRAAKTKRRTIIFSNTSQTADWIGLTLRENDINCIHLRGKMSSLKRRYLYEKFTTSEDHYILSCTDFVSRGLDTISTQHIINFDFPKFVADYIHRCGRVGRIGTNSNSAMITNFICYHEEVALLQKIEYAVRRQEELPNVNANIKRLYKDEKDQRDKAAAIQEREEKFSESLREDAEHITA